ncbi:hypothetical protein ABT174_27745 [Streptomyces sparsogenes]|uniref:hypothetical protein n=1 Tax=Streptomyces sparsogenes TaxID=67365 RepID=UPI00331A8DDA
MRLWVTLPPEPGERMLCVKTGAVLIPGTGLALIGGLLVLTDRRVYHGPLNTKLAGQLLSTVAGSAAPTGVDRAIELIVGWANKARAVRLEDITSVGATGRTVLHITTRDGKRRRFGIAANWRTPVWSRHNIAHRDEMVAAIQWAVQQAPRSG